MKKLLALLLVFLMITPLISFAEGREYIASDVTINEGLKISGNQLTHLKRGEYFGIKGVDLTGINSITLLVTSRTLANGETIVIKADDHLSGKVLGTITITGDHESEYLTTSVSEISGVHDVYFKGLYGRDNYAMDVFIEKIIFSEDEYKRSDPKNEQVPDSSVKDFYLDTWVATDSMGRKVADYAEAGPVKEGTRHLGVLYWNWFGRGDEEVGILEHLRDAHPDAMDDFYHPAWIKGAPYWWSEPVFGTYNSHDYWVYRKHAEMLSMADVDVILFDYSNSGIVYSDAVEILAKAFRDAKRAGVKVPKITGMYAIGDDSENNIKSLSATYHIFFTENDYSDLWYYMDGKPMVYTYNNVMRSAQKGDTYEAELTKTLSEFFTYRKSSSRNVYTPVPDGSDYEDETWFWLENFPQPVRGTTENGRPAFVVVGAAINQSTIYGTGITGVLSDPYSKGRGFSEVFGEDYSENGKRMGYFFREQAALALSADPEFILVDGWNEWRATRFSSYGVFSGGNIFVDSFDSENSRDFEPSKGPLKDDYFNLLVDFSRKYKGVRPAPVAVGAKTIDMTGDATQWNTVGPTFYNFDQSYERDSLGYYAQGTTEQVRYTTKVPNAIMTAKASFDDDNIYFLAKTKDAVKDSEGHMNLYINTDRNYATGWEGYDYAVNLSGKGVISKFETSAFSPETIGNAVYKEDVNYIMISLPRALIGETDKIELEFKWTDGIKNEGDLLSFYETGSCAPYGRFNYLFTEIEETTLSADERSALKGTTILKANADEMIVSGAKMKIYEPDLRVKAYEAEGTLYVPGDSLLEILGYGRSKVEYDPSYNSYFIYYYEMNDALNEVTTNRFLMSELNSKNVYVDGKTLSLSAPITSKDGIIYVPLSILSEAFGFTVASRGDGIYTVSKNEADLNLVNAVSAHLN